MSPQPFEPPPNPVAADHSPGPTATVFILLGALLALAIGSLLIYLPWTDEWTFNSIQEWNPTLEYYWVDPYFRGALSGLGLANVSIAVLELARILSRRSK